MNRQWQKQYAEAIELGAFDDPKGRALARLINRGVADEKILGLVNERLARIDKARLRGEIAPFAIPSLQNGGLTLGFDDRDKPVAIDPDSLCAHSFILGGSGAGKTTLLLFVLLQLLGHVPGLWLADLRKRDLRAMLPLAVRKGVPLSVVPIDRARINPLEFEGRDKQKLISRRVRSIGVSLGLPPRGRSVFAAACWKQYRRFGVLDRTDAPFPTLFDVYGEIRNDRSSNAQARHAVLDRLGAVLTELGPDLLAWRRGWRASQLATRSIVFEGGGLTERSVSLVIEHLLESRFMASVGVSNRPLSLLVALEDAQTLLGGAADDGEARVLDEMMALVRGSGIGMMLMAQSVHGVSPHMLSNTATKILGRVGHGGDVASMGRAMGLDHEQIRWSMSHLRPGVMVAQIADPRHRRPFVLRVPPMSSLPPVTDAEVEWSMKPLEALPTEFADEFRHWTPEERVDTRAGSNRTSEPPSAAEHAPNDKVDENTPPESTARPPMPDDAMRLLRAIDEHPGTPMNRIGTLAGLSNRKLYTLRTQMVEQGLIKAERLSINATGRPAVTLLLTPKGREALAGDAR